MLTAQSRLRAGLAPGVLAVEDNEPRLKVFGGKLLQQVHARTGCRLRSAGFGVIVELYAPAVCLVVLECYSRCTVWSCKSDKHAFSVALAVEG